MRISDWSSDVCSSDLCCDASLFEDAGKRADLELAVERNDAPRRAAAQDHVTAFLPDTGGPQIFQPANSLITGNPGEARRHVWTPRTSSGTRSEEHTSELQSLMRISYAVFCLKKKNKQSP